jgi:hypothetical protein
MFGWFKKKKQKELLNEIINSKVEEQATEAAIEAIKVEPKKEEVKKEEVVTYPKPNHFPDCNCFKCGRWKQQNAK